MTKWLRRIKCIAWVFLALGGGALAFGFMMRPQYGEWMGVGWAFGIIGLFGLWLSHDAPEYHNDGGTHV